MQPRGKNNSDMGHSLFLNSTCNTGENKRQGHATLPFLNPFTAKYPSLELIITKILGKEEKLV